MSDKEQTRETPEQEKLRKRQELATKRFHFLIAMLVLIVIFTVGSILMWITMPRTGPDGRPLATGGLFSVEKVILEGNTKYRQDTVLYESNVVVGQSIFTVKTSKVEQTLLDTFPYFTSVEVQTVGMSEVHIKVTETTSIGVVYDNGSWVSVGQNGKALDREPITSDLPKGRLFLKGTTAPAGGVTVGKEAMDEYSLDVSQTLIAAIEQYGLTDIIEIDMSNRSNIHMNWRGQIDIHLGNASNLTHEVGVVAAALPKILEARGQQVTGVLDVTSYSNEALDDKAVFTPSSLLTTPTFADIPATESE